jgi:hypothetical protein
MFGKRSATSGGRRESGEGPGRLSSESVVKTFSRQNSILIELRLIMAGELSRLILRANVDPIELGTTASTFELARRRGRRARRSQYYWTSRVPWESRIY